MLACVLQVEGIVEAGWIRALIVLNDRPEPVEGAPLRDISFEKGTVSLLR